MLNSAPNSLETFLKSCGLDADQILRYNARGHTDRIETGNPNLWVQFGKMGEATVGLREPNLSKVAVHFEGYEPKSIEIGNAGMSGSSFYQPQEASLKKIAQVANGRVAGSGVLVAMLANQFSGGSFNVQDARGDGFSTSKTPGANRAITAIHQSLANDLIAPPAGKRVFGTAPRAPAMG